MSTFKYVGRHEEVYFRYEGENHQIKKGSEFSTEDPKFCDILRGHPDMKEVSAEEKREDRKPPRKTDAAV